MVVFTIIYVIGCFAPKHEMTITHIMINTSRALPKLGHVNMTETKVTQPIRFIRDIQARQLVQKVGRIVVFRKRSSLFSSTLLQSLFLILSIIL